MESFNTGQEEPQFEKCARQNYQKCRVHFAQDPFLQESFSRNETYTPGIFYFDPENEQAYSSLISLLTTLSEILTLLTQRERTAQELEIPNEETLPLRILMMMHQFTELDYNLLARPHWSAIKSSAVNSRLYYSVETTNTEGQET